MRMSFLLALGAAFLLSTAAWAEEAPLQTPAELAEFSSTPDYEETLAFIRQLSAKMPEIRLEFFGTSAQGRALPVVIVAAGGAHTPAAAAATNRAIVLIQNGIHGGEIDGKDASLMLLRDLAEGAHRELLDRLILVIVPIYNVDGHQRISPFNRPNQNGPELGMGFRTTADGRDLNRDHVKLVTPEARAVIGLFNSWRPHLHVDNHVTDGSDHDWVLTYSWAESPQIAPPIQAWLSGAMPRVLAATVQAGHPVGPYVSLIDRSDPAKGFSSNVGEARYATGYYPLRHRPSILVENHAYKPYRARVLANRDFMLALLQVVAQSPGTLISAVEAAERTTVALGRPGADPSRATLSYRVLPATEKISFPSYEWYPVTSEVMGVPIVDYRSGQVRTLEVPWVHRVEPDKTVARPRGYLVEPGWPAIEARLAGHGLKVRQLGDPLSLAVETMRLSNPQQNGQASPSYQGLTGISVDVARRVEQREFPAGTLWIPADQPDFEVAVQLLEPEAPDSLVSWGLLSQILERKEYIEPRILERLAQKMLAQDEKLAADWRAALTDEAFAGDTGARYMWWYRRTPHWDDRVGLMPVMRMMTAPAFDSSPWFGPLVDP